MARMANPKDLTPVKTAESLPQRSGWQEFSGLYHDDRDCLASFLALECAEVIAGVKPANLISLANKRRSCGRNLYQLWKSHGPSLLGETELEAKVLADRGTSILLIFYRPDALRSLLAEKRVAVVLQKTGYPATATTEDTLSILQSRITADRFPHEIGVFLGYPLKDVVGFMGWGKPRFTCQGPWKIFGNPSESLRLAEKHKRCRCLMTKMLASGCNPHDCLRACGAAADRISEPAPFLLAG